MISLDPGLTIIPRGNDGQTEPAPPPFVYLPSMDSASAT